MLWLSISWTRYCSSLVVSNMTRRWHDLSSLSPSMHVGIEIVPYGIQRHLLPLHWCHGGIIGLTRSIAGNLRCAEGILKVRREGTGLWCLEDVAMCERGRGRSCGWTGKVPIDGSVRWKCQQVNNKTSTVTCHPLNNVLPSICLVERHGEEVYAQLDNPERFCSTPWASSRSDSSLLLHIGRGGLVL